MRRFTESLQIAVFGMALSSCCCGQSHQAPRSPSVPPETAVTPDNQSSEVPTHPLTFTSGSPVSGLKSSPVIILPTQCTSDGALFLDMLQAPSFMKQSIVEVTSKSSRGFDVSAIQDLHGIELLSFFPTDEHVSVLVRATKEATLPGEAQARQSDYGFFVAMFDRHGGFLKSVQLGINNVLPSHLAELSSGDFLVTAYDRANDMPRLYLVGSDGQVIHEVVMPESLGEYRQSANPNSPKGMTNRSRVLGSILMTAHGSDILVWRRGGRGPILRVSAHGNTKEIALSLPNDMVLAGVPPSDKLWVLQLKNAGEGGSGSHPTSATSYYLFDANDGSLTSKIAIKGDSEEHKPDSIFCEEGGEFYSYRTNEKDETLVLVAR